MSRQELFVKTHEMNFVMNWQYKLFIGTMHIHRYTQGSSNNQLGEKKDRKTFLSVTHQGFCTVSALQCPTDMPQKYFHKLAEILQEHSVVIYCKYVTNVDSKNGGVFITMSVFKVKMRLQRICKNYAMGLFF